MLVSELVYSVAIKLKMTEESNESALNFAISLNILHRNYSEMIQKVGVMSNW